LALLLATQKHSIIVVGSQTDQVAGRGRQHVGFAERGIITKLHIVKQRISVATAALYLPKESS
jgi:hypothetical protein